jgi:hypothetical protein
LFQNASPAINESSSLWRFCNVATSKKPPQVREFFRRAGQLGLDDIEHSGARIADAPPENPAGNRWAVLPTCCRHLAGRENQETDGETPAAR